MFPVTSLIGPALEFSLAHGAKEKYIEWWGSDASLLLYPEWINQIFVNCFPAEYISEKLVREAAIV